MKSVHFSDYVTIRLLFESDACREVRRSDWMSAAQNRQRFHQRIEACAKVIEFRLEPVHQTFVFFVTFYYNKIHVKKVCFFDLHESTNKQVNVTIIFSKI